MVKCELCVKENMNNPEKYICDAIGYYKQQYVCNEHHKEILRNKRQISILRQKQ